MKETTYSRNEISLGVLDALEMARDKLHRRVHIRPEGVVGFCDRSHCIGFTDINVCDEEGWVSSSLDDLTPERLAKGWEVDFRVNGLRYEVKQVTPESISIWCRGE